MKTNITIIVVQRQRELMLFWKSSDYSNQITLFCLHFTTPFTFNNEFKPNATLLFFVERLALPVQRRRKLEFQIVEIATSFFNGNYQKNFINKLLFDQIVLHIEDVTE